MKKSEEKVILTELGPFDPSQLYNEEQWPPRHVLSICLSNNDDDDSVLMSLQQGARNVLMKKYGYENWTSFLSEAKQSNHGTETPSMSHTADNNNTHTTNDLIDLLNTGKSNQRPLQWTLMECVPGCKFKLHAHPNLELVYCIEGALHEIRMQGPPPTTTFLTERQEMMMMMTQNTTTTTTEKKVMDGSDSVLVGPSVLQIQRPWKFGTLKQGEWLVNEIGSIHRSFTASICGCKLLVLWGGSHANIKEEPSLVSNAVLMMDERICSSSCSDSDSISETFLPESERKKNE